MEAGDTAETVDFRAKKTEPGFLTERTSQTPLLDSAALRLAARQPRAGMTLWGAISHFVIFSGVAALSQGAARVHL
jgi:hypothetical protein